MIRQRLYEMCNSICPTYSIGQKGGQITHDLFELRRDIDLPSMGNSLAGWDKWTVTIYSPTSPLQVDKLAKLLLEQLTQMKYEVINRVEGDNFDEMSKAFFTRVTFKTVTTYTKGGK